MARALAFLYGLAAYLLFVVVFLYAIGFVSGLAVPKGIDDGAALSIEPSFVVDILLMALFAVQHSVMARQSFKGWWTRFVPKAIERSTYVLLASLALALLFWQWRPIPAVVWQLGDPQWATLLLSLSFAGWVLVLLSTLMINHFELFGLQQVIFQLTGQRAGVPRFKVPLLYKFVRHPIYLGFIVAFWAAPVMTVGHLLFAAVTTAYIFIGIALEERDLVALFGDEYRNYRRRVSMLLPFRRGRV